MEVQFPPRMLFLTYDTLLPPSKMEAPDKANVSERGDRKYRLPEITNGAEIKIPYYFPNAPKSNILEKTNFSGVGGVWVGVRIIVCRN